MSASSITGVEEYIGALPDTQREIAWAIRCVIIAAAPDCAEAIRYGIPAFQVQGKSFLYFAVWKKHIGLYPVYRGSPAFEAQIGTYRAQKDTIRFPLAKPIPLDLVAKIVESQVSKLSSEHPAG